ncbi:MAG TPA: CHC2 zinc finger domain-containing protein [Candidatus Binatia bacterium]|nr:CHC2 zinc finger domain-containing protein [Candidatus Binatia bacterium]
MSVPAPLADRAERVKGELVDPAALGLESLIRDGRGWKARCCWHEERTGSLSIAVTRGRLLFHCFGCGKGGSALDVVAALHRLELRGEAFGRVVEIAEKIAGIVPGAPPKAAAAIPWPSSKPERTPPPRAEVLALWDGAVAVVDDPTTCAFLESRGIVPDQVADRGLARAVSQTAGLPRWARTAAGWWPDTGHCLIVETLDALGDVVSLHARAVRAGVLPKSLWPAGHAAAGVFADQLARRMLAGHELEGWDRRIIIAEGVPDFLTWAVAFGEAGDGPAVLGVAAGTWTQAIADRIPGGARVFLRTHRDEAGEKYASLIARTLNGRCEVLR